jgi:hypothetical protein
VTDAAQLLAGSPHWPEASQTAFNAWNNAYLEWLLSTPMGIGESRTANNHFTWFEVEALALALNAGNTTAAVNVAKRCTDASMPGALQHQIEPSGVMPKEAARTAAATYSTMNVLALFTLAGTREHVVGVTEPSLYTFQEPDGSGSMRRALDFLAQFGTNSSMTWP